MAHAVDLTTQRWAPEYRLPSPRTSLLGRDAEQRAIVERLLDPALSVLTITGPGGVGKTRLALQVANEVRGLAFPDGVVFVPLGDLRDNEPALQRIAQSLLIPAQDRTVELAQIVSAIGSRSMLLVLDNLEQLVDAAPLFAQLAEAGPKLKLLNTSRVPLRIRGEIEFPLAPLELPALDEHHAADIDLIGRSPAVALFIERARSVNPGFALTPGNAGDVAQLCARLDGLPLAIELAAARMKLLSPSALLARFSNRLRVLGGGARDLPERQQTLRQTIAWSYDLLDPDERAIFRALSIFPKSFDFPAAAAVTGLDVDDPLLLDWMTSLIDHSLIRRLDARGGESRLLMLETIREFGREQLKAYGEEDRVGDNHAAYFRNFVHQRSTSVVGYYDVVGSDQVEQELANVHQALAWYLDRDDADGVASIVAAMGKQWGARGYSIEGKRWIDRALGLIDRVEPATQSTILRSAAWFSASSGLLDEGLERAEQAVAISREHGLESELADGLNTLGVVHMFRREPDLSTACWNEGLELANQASLGTKAGILNNLGVVARINRDFDAAERYFNESLAAIPPERRQEKEGHAYVNLSEIAFERGDLPGARRLFNQGMVSFSEQRRLDELFMSIQGSAHLAFVEGYPRRAAMLWGWAEQLRERLGISPTAFELDGDDLTDKPIRETLGDSLFREMMAKGTLLSVEEIIALAIEGPTPEGEPGLATRSAPVANSAHLTSREIEVLNLVVAGKTNQEIADTLFISLRTAQTHVTNILRKVGVDSRAALAAYAVREGLA